MSKHTPPAPTVSAVDPCPTIIQIRRTPRYRKFTHHHRSIRPPQWVMSYVIFSLNAGQFFADAIDPAAG